MTIRILTICTGNICRSPLAAGLLAAKFDSRHFDVASAGTSPVVGEPLQETAQHIAARMGLTQLAQHRASGIVPEAVSNADLILGMDRAHRRATARLQPTAAKRSFTLLEFAHVVSYINQASLQTQLETHDDRALSALDTAMRMRGVVPRLDPPRLYDVPDPFGRSNQHYERSAKRIERAVEEIVAFFRRATELTEAATGRDDLLTTQDSEYPG